MRFPPSLTLAGLSIAVLMGGLGGTAMSQTDPSGNVVNPLPRVMVEAPKQVARHQNTRRHAAVGSTLSRRTSPPAETTTAAPTSVTAKLAKLASTAGSCVDGCQTSFKYGNAPWHGCSVSAGVLSPTCRNGANFKTYNECVETGLLVCWRNNDMSWYCSSIGMK